ncbi:flagellar type III secretion system protein FlhB [Paracoccus sp. 1_MG-2023]|uniref:flagellar type III secretion system protein FlhB n=1 Tax=unclassified Paracoccus (in: a-proteobacteria) TaxID=2688777 RepID=UPI001C0A34A3|nr:MULTISPECIES: flagellar type III secretion system protein FlhB [unclassified Paracoccus (in: a-proteobacteria)]MBU2956828.1 flagellar type III secretion system protein FlhB [Paracoccus sp. C2R09]MDO6670213.1 flagellar type III secretion system protein FlhB [Paracoccus sp. 1_MG-2023]
MSEDKDDKQFDPSEQRLQRAREKGDIPRSTELNVTLMYLGAVVAFTLGAGVAVRQWIAMAMRALGSEGWRDMGVAAPLALWAGAATVALAAVIAGAILVGLIATRGLAFAPDKIAPDLKRIDPIKNAKQKFGGSGLTTFAISVGKAAVVCAGGWFLFAALLDRIAGSAMAGGQWVGGLGLIIWQVLALGLVVSIAFTLPDMLIKWFEHRKRNRMSRKEMEDEFKDSEGDPHLKAARRQRAVDLATGQMIADVAKADVIIVNPTHYAVALQWSRGSGRAPVCLAKGVDEVAARIREKAGEHGVPLWSDPPCARAIHASVKVGDEIMREHFAAVAAAIRFAERMREKARRGW